MQDESIRYLVADDNLVFRRSFVALLEALPNLELVGEASSAAMALELVRKQRPQVVLLDYSLPESDGVQAARAILAVAPETAVCLLTMAEQQHDLLAATAAGVRGLLPKDSPITAVQQAMTTLAHGDPALPATLAVQLLGTGDQFSAAPTPNSTRFESLGTRERAVVYGIAQAWSNQQIAAHLGITVPSVRARLRRVYRTLGVRGRRQAAAFMRQLGW